MPPPPTKVKTGPISLLIKTPEDITSAWLTELFDEPTKLVSVGPVGTGQVASTFRIKFENAAGQPDTVVIKISSDDEGSRNFGVEYGAYEKETQFYANLGLIVAATGAVPQCWLSIADVKGGWFSLVLEDIKDGVQGDQMKGLSLEEVKMGLETMAKLHGPFVNNKELQNSSWIKPDGKMDAAQAYRDLVPEFCRRYESLMEKKHIDVVKWLCDHIGEVFNEPIGTLDCIRHQDYRPDNMLFTHDRCVAVDFQGVGYGVLMHDCSFFIGGSLKPEDRLKHEKELVRGYLEKLQERTETKIDWDTAWFQYRRQSLTPVWVAVLAGGLVVRTERGDRMFMAMESHAAQHAIDLDVMDIFNEIAAKKKATATSA